MPIADPKNPMNFDFRQGESSKIRIEKRIPSITGHASESVKFSLKNIDLDIMERMIIIPIADQGKETAASLLSLFMLGSP